MSEIHAHEAIADFVSCAFANPPSPPTRLPKVAKQPSRYAGIWSTLETPEERSALGRQLAAKRDPHNMRRPFKRTRAGVPNGWTGEAVAAAVAKARLEATQLVQTLKAQGIVQSGDPEQEAATIEALTLIRSPGGNQKRLRAARRLLKQFNLVA